VCTYASPRKKRREVLFLSYVLKIAALAEFMRNNVMNCMRFIETVFMALTHSIEIIKRCFNTYIVGKMSSYTCFYDVPMIPIQR
jgi:hypothetical protein